VPSQLLTIALAFAPTLASALTIFIARACICSMDVSVRGAFLSGIVPKESRTRFLGISTSLTFALSLSCFISLSVPFLELQCEWALIKSKQIIVNVCKTLASAPGPTLAGVFASFGGLRWTFVIAGSIKLICGSFFPHPDALGVENIGEVLMRGVLIRQMISHCG
jgi:hypothetical protein